MTQKPLILDWPHTDPFVKVDGIKPGFERFRKELIPEGNWLDANGVEVPVPTSRLQHWAVEHSRYVAAGNKVPAPVEHTFDPEKNRGYWDLLTVEENSRGTQSLFGYIDLPAGSNLARTQVSIWAEPDVQDGAGNKFSDVILHACFTDYPQIPGMDAAQRVVCSRPIKKEPSVPSFEDIAKSLNITPAEGESAEDAIKRLTAAGLAAASAGDEDEEDVEEPEEDADDGDQEDDEDVTGTGALEKQVAALSRQNRKMQIQQLQTEGYISPAQASELEKEFCGTALKLSSLSTDGFEQTLKVLRKGVKMSATPGRSRTTNQANANSSSGGKGKRLVDFVKGRKKD